MTFINYFASETRDSPFNLAVARILLGFYALWKITSYVDWSVVQAWPVYLHDEYQALTISADLWYLPFERWILVLALTAFLLGYKTRVTGFVSALLLAHVSAVLNMITTGGTSTTFLYPVYFLLLFALFAEQDKLSVDGARRTADRSIGDLSNRLRGETDGAFAMAPLKWSLVTLGIIYAHSGLTKIIDGPLAAWIDPANLARYLTLWQTISGRELLLADVVGGSVLAAGIVAAGTVFLETGFIIAILLRRRITLFVLGLAGMHTGIALAMTPYFFDMYLVYFLFIQWDKIYSKLARSDDITVVYDSGSDFCVRALAFLQWLDINRTLQSTPLSAEEDILREYDVDPANGIFVVENGDVFSGYHAIRMLFVHFGIFYPIALAMTLPPVERIGAHVFRQLAGDSDVHFQRVATPQD